MFDALLNHAQGSGLRVYPDKIDKLAADFGYRDSQELQEKLWTAYNVLQHDKRARKPAQFAMVMLDLDLSERKDEKPVMNAFDRQYIGRYVTGVWRPHDALRTGIGLLVHCMVELRELELQ